jgi:hypothetical protein
MGKAQRFRDEAGAYKKQVELQAIANVARFNNLLPVYKQEPEIIQSQIYFDTMQSVLEKNKVFVVDGNGNNNLFLWPENASLSKDLKNSLGEAVGSSLNDSQVGKDQTENSLKRTTMTKAQYLRWMEANK